MKHHGSTSDFIPARDAELFLVFRSLYLAAEPSVPASELLKQAVEAPCSRLWVSERHATDVIGRILRERKSEIIRKNAGLGDHFTDLRRESKRQAIITRALPNRHFEESAILNAMLPEKKAMFTELLNRVLRILEAGNRTTLTEAVFQGIHQPAPRFFLAPRSAEKILARHRCKKVLSTSDE